MISVIGKGEYGCVSKGKCLKTGDLVAIKIVENHDNTEYDIIKVIREILILRRLNYLQNMLGVKGKDAFVPKVYDIICPLKKDIGGIESGSEHLEDFLQNMEIKKEANLDISSIDQICIVMELAQTDVEKMFRFPIDFNQHHLIKVFYGCISSMAFLHQANVIHRDLKTANILIESNCTVKFCDFGLSRSMPPSFQQVRNF